MRISRASVSHRISAVKCVVIAIFCVPQGFREVFCLTGDQALSELAQYKPCYPIPIVDEVLGKEVMYTRCGDEAVGEDNVWWQAVEPTEQCFGASTPENKCSRSTTATAFHCLAGPAWDAARQEADFPTRQRPSVVGLEVGNWLTAALGAAAARILLEEMMNYKVAMVARLGAYGAYERAARRQLYANLEVWGSDAYQLASDQYTWGDVIPQPFIENKYLNEVAWAATGEVIPDQPATSDLKMKTLAIRDGSIDQASLGFEGKFGMFVTGPVLELQKQDKLLIADYWRGHLHERTLAIFPPDGTISCKERLKTGQDCEDPQRTFFCPRECPNPLFGGSQASCCINGKFYPPQCIPPGVTYEDILADPEWASPYCREFLKVDMTWELSYHESIIVNLGLNYTVHYVGYNHAVSLVRNRTLQGVPTLFAWWKPDPLVALVNAQEVILPFPNSSIPETTSKDPMAAAGRVRLPEVHVKKLVHRAASSLEPDFYQFVQNVAFSDKDADVMLRLHKAAGGEFNIEEAACQWVKSNSDKWMRWVSNEHTSSPKESTLLRDMAFTIVAVALLLVLVLVVAIRHLKRAASKHLYLKWEHIVFTDPPTVIGTGPMGEVHKGEYRSMPVAVKPMLPTNSTQSFALKVLRSFTSKKERMLSSDSTVLMDRLESLQRMTQRDHPRGFHDLDVFPEPAQLASASERSFTVSQSTPDLELGRESDDKLVSPRFLRVDLDEEGAGRTSLGGRMCSTSRSGVPALSASMIQSLQEINSRTRRASAPGTDQLEEVGRVARRARVSSWGKKFISVKRDLPLSELDTQLHKEVALLSKIRNPYLISFYGLTTDPKTKMKYVVTEFMEESLHELIHNSTVALDENILVSIVKNIAVGMNYLHSMEPPVLHGTLRAVNVLVDLNFTAKVAEFGLTCKSLSDGKIFATAPEKLTGRVTSPTKAQDVYSFGTLMYEMFMRMQPTEEHDPHEWLDSLAADQYQPLQVSEDKCTNATIRALVLQCQALNPMERPSFSQIHQVLQRVDTSISQFMQGLASKNRLLNDILPPKIGELLAQGKKVEPEHHECVTIFFSDIVGFTTISAQQAPKQVMEMLDRLYGKFDKLVKKHGLFKVETIGDAYMAVGNLSAPQPDHAARVARFAMDAVEAAKRTLVREDDPSLGVINIRVGFHSGPVVASVVGTTNPRYCLFGDTVNTASRMESSSEANCIHLSDKAANALNTTHHSVSLVYRGCNNIKGKGRMHTYWIRGFHMGSEDDGDNADEHIVSRMNSLPVPSERVRTQADHRFSDT